MSKPSYTLVAHQDHKRYLDMLKVEFQKKLSDLQPCAKTPNDYDRIKAIGNGAYGEVYLVRDKASFSYHAMKVVDKSVVVQRKHVKHVLLEKKIMQCIQFPNVVKLDASFKDNAYIYFVLPYLAGGDLFTFVQKYGQLSDSVCTFYASQVTLAIEYLHHCDIVHRDIKPENILLGSNGYLKLCDFGFSKIIRKKTWTLCGTPEYLAPEMILSKGYSFGVDWWALGVLIFEMRVGHPPFFYSDLSKLYEAVLDGNYRFPENFDSECKKLIKGLLQVEPTRRLGCLKHGSFDVKSHEWFKEISWAAILHQRDDPPYMPTCPSPGDTSNFPDIGERKFKHASKVAYQEEFMDF